MGIVVTKDSLRPYNRISTVDEHHSINMELGESNGVSSITSKNFSKQRWDKMFNKSQNNRFAITRNGEQIRAPKTTFGR